MSSALIVRSPSDVIVGVARYDSTEDPEVAELALVVVDEWQGRGLGRLLLRKIMSAAGEHGHRRFRASVLLENYPMLHLLDAECDIRTRSRDGGVVTLTFSSRYEAAFGRDDTLGLRAA